MSALLAEAVEIYPGHPDGHLPQTQLLSMADEYKDVMNNGIEAFSKGRWQKAQANFERASQLNPCVPTIIRLIDFLIEVQQQVATTRSVIDTALGQGNARKAMYLARQLDRYLDQIKGLVR